MRGKETSRAGENEGRREEIFFRVKCREKERR